MKTAVILFAYNRPLHTRKVVEGLKRNDIKELFVFCDGIKNENHKEDVLKTRKIIDDINWCSVKKNYSVENKGLAKSVIYGVTSVFNLGYERVIVVEDDCIPKDDFIEYMNEAFDFYEDDEKVMHISGFGLPMKQKIQRSTYLTPYPCSWGWGTWKKYWMSCNFEDTDEYEKLLKDEKEIKKFNYSGSAFSDFLDRQLNGKVNSWLIRWYFHIYKNDGVCVWKTKSDITNDGFDGTGVHKVKFDRFNQKEDEFELVYEFEESIIPKNNIIKEFKRYFIDKSFSERLKTVIYMYTGIIVG
ncbi:hypothetical protein R0131_05620 [Clostridium sp. AL.422]|uniref:hypothetical protein n=1 Tax=Clostridium TaxID=1485 RepID=UPI00293DB6A6|nr:MULTISPECIES: hypothetical protein [unclassified Clostridium]MDV4150306.1 hypothetical protein [Clostridium sp. AL.422]